MIEEQGLRLEDTKLIGAFDGSRGKEGSGGQGEAQEFCRKFCAIQPGPRRISAEAEALLVDI